MPLVIVQKLILLIIKLVTKIKILRHEKTNCLKLELMAIYCAHMTDKT